MESGIVVAEQGVAQRVVQSVGEKGARALLAMHNGVAPCNRDAGIDEGGRVRAAGWLRAAKQREVVLEDLDAELPRQLTHWPRLNAALSKCVRPTSSLPPAWVSMGRGR